MLLGNKAAKIVISIPRKCGFLPLMPIFAGLGAFGVLNGGVTLIAKAINDAKSAALKLKEVQRHNKSMEAIAMGEGLYLKKRQQGLGQ